MYKENDRVKLKTGQPGTVVKRPDSLTEINGFDISSEELVVNKDYNCTGEPYSIMSSVYGYGYAG